jgi:alkyl hydroperoxide reductase subunit AhpC
MPAQIGKRAPDFTADAYHRGQQRKVSLSGLRGKWVLLFFYLGDFTSI